MNLNELYTNYSEDERLLQDRAHKMEYLTTIYALEKYINSETDVIELGAGEGAYASYFHDKCKKYHATDLVEKHVQRMTEKFAGNSNIKTSKLNVLNLAEECTQSYDLVLCLGPYYHLQQYDQRMKCIDNCKKITKEHGFMAFSYINKLFVNQLYNLDGIFFNDTEYELLRSGKNSLLSNRDSFLGLSYFNTPEEIESELIKNDLEIVDHLRTDGPYIANPETLEKMNEDQYKSLIEYHIHTCREKSALSMTNHGLVLCKKRLPTSGLA